MAVVRWVNPCDPYGGRMLRPMPVPVWRFDRLVFFWVTAWQQVLAHVWQIWNDSVVPSSACCCNVMELTGRVSNADQ